MILSSLFVSVVAPFHNEGDCLETFVDEALAELQSQFGHYEIVLVDNGSTDASAAVAARLTERHAGVRLVRLAHCRNPDVPIIAGLETAIGDFVAVAHPASDPVAGLGRVLEHGRRGADVVQGNARAVPGEGLLLRLGRALFYGVCRRWLGLAVPPRSGTLRGFSRRAVNALLRVRHKQPHLGVHSSGLGFVPEGFDYDKVARGSRPAPRGLLAAFDRGMNLLILHSVSPLRFISYLGVLAGTLNVLYVLYVVAINLVKHDVAAGWTSLSLQNALMFFLVFLILVLMAEYLGRILEESKERPLYHVLEELGGSSTGADDGTRNVVEQSPVLGNPDPGRKRRDAA